MDDSCAVCAETLEWVAYGPCGHREVCSTCIIRLRFICNDQCCCICKSKSRVVFVTKALGQYTRMINDFSAFPTNLAEGQAGEYWFHGGAQAYFDDLDHFKMIKAMCRLSCIVCERKHEQRNGGAKRTGDFNSIEQLKIHLFHQHRLFMCSLCLEGRKIFISEQKLYNKAQLNQHVKSGDSVVDGSEIERGGFSGHPMCEFCQNPFFGDNELYLHMSTEHFTCHICQRQNPGKYEYYADYDNLEIHFRQQHLLCEDEACLAKKFIVFASKSEIKRHDAMEHGGRMSRSKRNAAMQIPTSFQFQRSHEDHRGRRPRNHPNSSDIQLSLAIQDSVEAFNAVRSDDIPLNGQSIMASTDNPYQLLANIDPEPYLRSSKVLGQNATGALLEESSFPLLPMAPSSSNRGSRNAVGGSSQNTMAARLRQHGTVKVINTSRASPAAIHHRASSAGTSYQSRAVLDSWPFASFNSPSSSQFKPASSNEYALSSNASSIPSRPSAANDRALPFNLASSSQTRNSTSKVGHSSLSPNLKGRETLNNSISNSQSKVEDVQSANKVLLEKVRGALDFDEEKVGVFKVISVEYRKDLIDVGEYLAYVHQFGLSHLILELAMLCPDAQKQRELVEIHKYNTRTNTCKENGLSIDNGGSTSKKSSKKGKEKCKYNGSYASENDVAESLNREVKNLLLNDEPSLKEVKGKSKILAGEQAKLNLSTEAMNKDDAESTSDCSKKNVGTGGGGNKPHKKVPKFLKNRLGDTSSANALPESRNGDLDPDPDKGYQKKDPPETFPIHGVWRNGGGRRLVVMTQRDRKK